MLSSDLQNGIFQLKDQVPKEAIDKTFTLTAFEEPPVLGARLLTQTNLKEPFPPLK